MTRRGRDSPAWWGQGWMGSQWVASCWVGQEHLERHPFVLSLDIWGKLVPATHSVKHLYYLLLRRMSK